MCLVENAQHKKIFAYIQKRLCTNNAARQLFCSSLLFCFRELNHFLESSVRDSRKFLWVSRNAKLDPRNSTLDPQKSKLETRFSKTLRIESEVSSRDCQLTFERYCMQAKQACTSMLQQWHWKGGGDTIVPQPAMEVIVQKTHQDLDRSSSREPGVRCLLYKARTLQSMRSQRADEQKLREIGWRQKILKWHWHK